MTDISTVYQEQRKYFDTGATRSIAFRKEQLRKLKSAVMAHEAEITAALYQDLRKSEYEAFGSEPVRCSKKSSLPSNILINGQSLSRFPPL